MSKMLKRFLFPIILVIGLPTASLASDDYGRDVGMKLGSGFSNMALGWLELPKTVLITSNQTNLILGFSGGVAKGTLHLVGRTLAGVVDFVSFPLPTKPIVDPEFIWQNFDVETHYNPAFQLKD